MANIGIWAGKSRLRAHGNVAGEQHAIELNPERSIPTRVVRTHGDKLNLHAAEIDGVVIVEGHIGLAEIRVLQQLGIDGRAARKYLRKLQAEFRDVLHLVIRPDHRGALGKGLCAEIVFRMEMRGDEIERSRTSELLCDLQYSRPVAWSK